MNGEGFEKKSIKSWSGDIFFMTLKGEIYPHKKEEEQKLKEGKSWKRVLVEK